MPFKKYQTVEKVEAVKKTDITLTSEPKPKLSSVKKS